MHSFRVTFQNVFKIDNEINQKLKEFKKKNETHKN